MATVRTDIDIDFKDRTTALSVLSHIPASMVNQGKVVKHNTGVYFQNIPVDPTTDLASITYEKADDIGYFKIDLLNNSIYSGVRDNAHLAELLASPVNWSLLDDSDIVGMLAHIHNHFDIVSIIKPKSIIDLSVVLALIRPGKRHLLNSDRSIIDNNIWHLPSDGSYHFKRAHAISYAVSITMQMNLIVEQALSSS